MQHYTLLCLAVITALSTGCLSARKMDKWINKHYEATAAGKIKNNDYVSFYADTSIVSGNKISVTQKQKSTLLPALFYWKWEHTTVSVINSNIPLNSFSTSFISYANAKGLKEKLNGRKLELTINGNPANFSFTEKGDMIIILLFYISRESIYITPESQVFSVSYKVLNGTEVVKNGEILIGNANKKLYSKRLQPLRKMTWNYLETADNNIKTMCKELVDKLAIEL